VAAAVVACATISALVCAPGGGASASVLADPCVETPTFIADAPLAIGTLEAEKVWAHATGKGVLVAVVDSGIDIDNPHLSDVVVGGTNLVGDGTNGSGYTDIEGHGTAVAGLIAAQRVEGSGVIGLAPDARLLSVRVFRGTDDESVKAGFGPTPSRLARGIRYAADHGADIINVSLSVTGESGELADAIDFAAARGSLVVASAGNRGTSKIQTDGVRYPAGYDTVLGVAATNNLGVVTSDSIHGPQVGVAAPGFTVLTTASRGRDCSYANDEPSTSFATGYTSAAAALIAEEFPNESAAEWKYRLEASAVRALPDSRDDVSGWGVINPLGALELVPGASTRGPASPFTQSTGSAHAGGATSVDLAETDRSADVTRYTMIMILIGAAAVLGTVGAILVLRRHRRTTTD
jgi:membrane-anchored mycosin MYCP